MRPPARQSSCDTSNSMRGGGLAAARDGEDGHRTIEVIELLDLRLSHRPRHAQICGSGIQDDGASHASMTDSSSSFEAARRPSLRLGFVDDSVDPAALRAVHADKVGGRPRWPCAPPLELHAPPCPACGGATQCQKAGDIITMGTRRLQRRSRRVRAWRIE